MLYVVVVIETVLWLFNWWYRPTNWPYFFSSKLVLGAHFVCVENILFYDTDLVQWVLSQYCGCWRPGTSALGHQQPQNRPTPNYTSMNLRLRNQYTWLWNISLFSSLFCGWWCWWEWGVYSFVLFGFFFHFLWRHTASSLQLNVVTRSDFSSQSRNQDKTCI